MSELDAGPKARFPIREREHTEKHSSKRKLVAPKELRKELVEEFDAESVEALSPEIEELFKSAEVSYSKGVDGKAYQEYMACINSGSYNPSLLFTSYKNIGNILVRSGDLEGAEEYYNKAFTIEPDSDVLLVNLGTLEVQKQNFEKALERYRMAVDINPLNQRGWVGLAIVHREYGDMILSWGNLEKSLDINPSDETALELMVQWGIKDSKFDSLILRLENYLHINSQNTHMRGILARVFIIGGRLFQAKSCIEECIKQSPDDEEFVKILESLNQSSADIMEDKVD